MNWEPLESLGQRSDMIWLMLPKDHTQGARLRRDCSEWRNRKWDARLGRHLGEI